MRKPIIGLTPQYDTEENTIWMRHQYTDALTKSGAITMLLVQYAERENISELCDNLDGILFSGGGDVDPAVYGEERLPECGEPSKLRDDFELALYEEAVKRDMPIFGICRGIQLINVGAGGTLFQHVDGNMSVRHSIEIARGSLLYDIIGAESVEVNSYHHQAVKAPAPNMTAAAWSDVPECKERNLIECIYDKNARFNLSVQWHPENMYPDDEYSRRLFDAFVKACREYAAEK